MRFVHVLVMCSALVASPALAQQESTGSDASPEAAVTDDPTEPMQNADDAILVEPDTPTRIPWEVYVGTRAPALIGAGVVYPLPARVRLVTEIGILPGGYVDLINATAEAFSWYGPATSELVSVATANSLLIHVDAGYQFFPDKGFYAGIGYSIATLGGGTTTEELLESILDEEVPSNPSGVEREFAIDSTLHNFELVLGWRFDLPSDFTIRTELGLLWTLGSRVGVELEGGRGDVAAEVLERAAEVYLEDIYTTYVISPTVGIWFGKRF